MFHHKKKCFFIVDETQEWAQTSQGKKDGKKGKEDSLSGDTTAEKGDSTGEGAKDEQITNRHCKPGRKKFKSFIFFKNGTK